MPAATAAPARHRANTAREGLRCRVRLADGRVFAGRARAGAPSRAAARHPARADDRAGRDRRGRPPRRPAADHDPPPRRPLPARRTGRRRLTGWSHCWRSPRGTPTPARRCSSPRPFGRRRGATSTRSARPASCGSTSTEPDGLPALWAFLAERPCHLLVESSAGHAHAYWKLDRAAAGDSGDRVDRRAGRADRARAPAADPPPRHRRGRQAERRRPGVRGARRGSCASPAA